MAVYLTAPASYADWRALPNSPVYYAAGQTVPLLTLLGRRFAEATSRNCNVFVPMGAVAYHPNVITADEAVTFCPRALYVESLLLRTDSAVLSIASHPRDGATAQMG